MIKLLEVNTFKKFFIVVFVAFVVYAFMTHIPENLVGSLKGYGDCPNCHDSWMWKESGHITYTNLEEGKDYAVKGNRDHIVTLFASAGVMICKECLEHPERLNPDRIKKDLVKSDWKEEKADLAAKAVARYKAEHTKQRI